MPSVELSWEQISVELAEWERKLASGYTTLQKAAAVQPGGSSRQLVYTHEKARLFHYEATRPNLQQAVPTLIVYALVNRPTMADLEPDRSLIRGLLDRGVDVYLIEWEDPSGLDCNHGLSDYILRNLGGCVEFLTAAGRPLNLLGICQGGTFALCYSALNPSQIRNLVVTVTPVDFHTSEDMLSSWLRYVDLALLGRGNIPGDLLNALFLSLKPLRLAQQKYVGLGSQLDDQAAVETFMRMEKWIFDSPDLAGRALREFAQYFYRDNCLIKGGLTLDGRPVDLNNLRMPVLNVYASEDHLVPRAASQALRHHVGSKDYSEIEVPGGHIGIYVGAKTRQRVAEGVADWLKDRS